MKRTLIVFLLLLTLLFSCAEEEFVSQRNYPFIESLGITDIDQSGVTVIFETRKKGQESIDEYGVEFLEANLARSGEPNLLYLKSSQTGEPDASKIEWRISYDLYDNEEYLVKPFVRMGNTVVYGESLVFDSQGVKPPTISNVTPTEIYQVNQLTIKGDFFNSAIERNKVIIPGLENAFLSIINTVSPTELQVTLILLDATSIDINRTYDLKITSANKFTVLPNIFTIVLPKIEQINPLVSYVGQKVDIHLNQSTAELGGLGFKLFNSNQSFDFLPKPAGSGVFQTVWPNVPPGKYKTSVSVNGYTKLFEEEIEILDSWEIFRENLPFSNPEKWRKTFVGDKLLLWSPSSPEFQVFYSYDVGENIFRPMNPKQAISAYRESPLSQSVGNKFLYFGLGNLFDKPLLTDFNRFDTELNRWESLSEYPFENSRVEKSFEYQGKIYLVLIGEQTFITYDLISNTWTRTEISVPEGMMSTLYLDASEQGVFYIPKVNTLQLIRYIPGFEEESYLKLPFNFMISDYFVRLLKNQLFIFNGSGEYFRVNLNTKEITPLQTIDGITNIRATPWATSKGLMMIFPIREDLNQIEDRIYRLVMTF